MIWGILVLVIGLLAIMPIGINAVYAMDGAVLRLILGPVRFLVFPKPKNTNKGETEQTAGKKKAQGKTEKKGGNIQDFYPLVHKILDFLGDLRKKLRVDRLELKVIMAGDDPCDLAVNYGRAWAALGNLMPQLERVFVIKKRNLEVECDFTAQSTCVYARVDLTITVARILSLVLRHGCHILKEYFKITNERKGGAKL